MCDDKIDEPFANFQQLGLNGFSVLVSSAEVAMSSIKTTGFLSRVRAMATCCLSWLSRSVTSHAQQQFDETGASIHT